MSVCEYMCNSQTTSEGSESTLLVAFLYSPWQPSFGVDYDVS